MARYACGSVGTCPMTFEASHELAFQKLPGSCWVMNLRARSPDNELRLICEVWSRLDWIFWVGRGIGRRSGRVSRCRGVVPRLTLMPTPPRSPIATRRAWSLDHRPVLEQAATDPAVLLRAHSACSCEALLSSHEYARGGSLESLTEKPGCETVSGLIAIRKPSPDPTILQ